MGALAYHFMLWAFGAGVCVGIGFLLTAGGLQHPETVLFWLLLVWSAWRAIVLLLYLRRFV